MTRGEKTKLLWKDPEYRKMMSENHKGNKGYWKGTKLSEQHKKNLKGSHGNKFETAKRSISNGYKIFWYENKVWYEQRQVWIDESDWHFIPKRFVIHHINGCKIDNRIENLACIPIDVHNKIHNGKYWGINAHLGGNKNYA